MSIGEFQQVGRSRFDPELVGLIGFNVALLVAYFLGNQQPMVVVYGYFVQSLFVGIQTWLQQVIDLWRARRAGTGELPIDSFLLFFFPIHFGGFHLGYFIFLLFNYRPERIAPYHLSEILGWAAAWGLLQLVIYLWRELSASQPDRASPNIFFAYLRIIPMHLFILLGGLGFGDRDESPFGFGLSFAFVLFVGLKAMGDVILYRWGTRIAEK